MPFHDKHGTVLATVREFSNTYIYTPGYESETLTNAVNPHCPFSKVTVFPNGYDSSSEGSVSIQVSEILMEFRESLNFDLTVTVSVIDNEGNRRFPQSVAVFYNQSKRTVRNIRLDNYIFRSSLLQEPSDELLPNDTLTLQVDFTLRCQRRNDRIFPVIDESCLSKELQIEENPDGSNQNIFLPLNSAFMENLAKESPYFMRLRVTPMAELTAGKVTIPQEEHKAFLTIQSILFDLNTFDLCSLREIFDVYIAAEKYDIGIVMDTCRRWLNLCLSQESSSDILELAEKYNDYILMEIVNSFQRGDETVKERKSRDLFFGDVLLRVTKISDGDWVFKGIERHLPDGSISETLTFQSKTKSFYEEKNELQPTYEFYS